MLLDSCRNLHQLYLEIAHTINSLESLGQSYRWGKHKEYYFEKLQFYQDILKGTQSVRRMHFPKILKDARGIEKQRKILEKNKSELRVYSSLGNVGDANFNRGIIY